MSIEFICIGFFDPLFTRAIRRYEFRWISFVVIFIEFREVKVPIAVNSSLNNVALGIVVVDLDAGVVVRFKDAGDFHAASFRIRKDLREAVRAQQMVDDRSEVARRVVVVKGLRSRGTTVVFKDFRGQEPALRSERPNYRSAI